MNLWDRLTGKSAQSLAPANTSFEHVDSREKAQALCKSGKLHRVMMFPLEFGGSEGELNAGYLTAKAVQEKARIDATIFKMAQEGPLGYEAKQLYKGRSFVPSQVVIIVSAAEQHQFVVEVW